MNLFLNPVSRDVMDFTHGYLQWISVCYFNQEPSPDPGRVEMNEDGIQNKAQA